MAGRIAAARPATPSLFVWGAADQLVPPERSRQLMDCFDGPVESFEHPGAHMVRLLSGAHLVPYLTSPVGENNQDRLFCADPAVSTRPAIVVVCFITVYAPSLNIICTGIRWTVLHACPSWTQVPSCTGDFKRQLLAFLDRRPATQ